MSTFRAAVMVEALTVATVEALAPVTAVPNVGVTTSVLSPDTFNVLRVLLTTPRRAVVAPDAFVAVTKLMVSMPSEVMVVAVAAPTAFSVMVEESEVAVDTVTPTP